MSVLKCPVCGQSIDKQNLQYVCKNRHSFDISKQGYSNFLLKQSSKLHGDNLEMLLARKHVQEKGFYDNVANKMINILSEVKHEKILDIGCGTGYYTSKIQKKFLSEVYGIDISKEALKIASKDNKEITYLVSSNKKLPVIDNSIDVVLNVFSPLYLEEVARVLKQNGYILVVSSNENHLIELKEIIYDSIIKKDEDRNVLIDEKFILVKDENIVEHIALEKEDLQHLFLMTPHYWTSSVDGKKRLNNIDNLNVQININFKLYKYEN